MATVLGLNFFFHDSAASIVMDGNIVAAVAEERLCRDKHTNKFPKLSIEYCLQQANLNSINDIDVIVFYEKPLMKLLRIIETSIATWPKSSPPFTSNLPIFLKTKTNIRNIIKKNYPNYHGNIVFNEHHLSHAASAFFPSPYSEAAIISIDGVGEWETTTIGYGKGNKIRLDRAIHFPHSIGLFYSALTAYLGFRVNDGEWKVMGLAPYGEPRYVEQFKKLLFTMEDGSYCLNMDYFAHHRSNKWSFNRKRWDKLFGFPQRRPEEPIEQRHEDLARSGQAVVEDLILSLAKQARQRYQTDNLVIAGGVGLNSVANWKIEKEGIFNNVWIQPAAGDDGASLGAALYVSHQIFNEQRHPMKHAYLGPDFSDEEIVQFLQERNIPFEEIKEEDLAERVADLVARGQVIGWYQGRMEFGPRSLGNRSILADATRSEMKDTINAKIKFREYFRPFAPSVPLEYVHEYFEVEPNTELPFMLKVPKVRPEMQERLPAITHADGTGRVQTVRKDTNRLFYQILISLKKHTGIPVAVNTSFNVRGEPIVCSPFDAYNCFIHTGLDGLFLNRYLITQKPSVSIDFEEEFKKSDALEKQRNSNDTNQSKIRDQVHDKIDQTIIDTHDPQKVLQFYKSLPFNFYSNSTDASLMLMKKNQIEEYPNLHRILKVRGNLAVLDVGCGAGWFVNSCAFYYPHRVMGMDFNPIAIKQAIGVSRLMKNPEQTEFVIGDILTFEMSGQFDIINSLGVLHHTEDCHKAIKRLISWLKPEGYIHIGLYHSYSRKPFLSHFKKMQDQGCSVELMFDEFRKLKFPLDDQVHLYSWFRDQVLHPHETQHSYEEISELLKSEGLKICSTSINKFKPITSNDSIIEKEKKLEKYARKQLEKKCYFPGFFTILASKN